MTKPLNYVALWLTGALVLLFTYFRVDLLSQVSGGDVLIKILIPASLLLSGIYFGKIMGIKPWVTILLLVVAEVFFHSCFEWVALKKRLPSHLERFLSAMYIDRHRNFLPDDDQAQIYSPSLFYTYRPGSFQFSNIEFSEHYQINQAGFRDDDDSSIAPDIIFLGDSYTMGWGVPQDKTMAALIEKSTGKKCLNAGRSSYGTSREYVALQGVDKQNSQVLVLQFFKNDTIENRAFVENNYSLKVSPPAVLEGIKRWNKMWKGYFPFKYDYIALFRLCHLAKDAVLDKNSQPDQLTEQSLADFFGILALIRESFPGKIILFNAKEHNAPSIIQKQFIEWLDAHPMPDVYVFRAEDCMADDDYFVLDEHFNANGHNKLAQHLTAFLSEINQPIR